MTTRSASPAQRPAAGREGGSTPHGDVWAGETEPPAWEDVDVSALTRPHAVLAFADAVSGRVKGGVR
jgi:hypothetical protein